MIRSDGQFLNFISFKVALLRLSNPNIRYAAPRTIPGEASFEIDDVGSSFYVQLLL